MGGAVLGAGGIVGVRWEHGEGLPVLEHSLPHGARAPRELPAPSRPRGAGAACDGRGGSRCSGGRAALSLPPLLLCMHAGGEEAAERAAHAKAHKGQAQGQQQELGGGAEAAQR